MKTVGLIALVSLFAVFCVPAEAKNRNNRQIAEQARKEKARKEKERAERKEQRDKLGAFMKPRDANKDGSLSKDEFLAVESDRAGGEEKFKRFNKNGDRFLSKSEIQAMLGN